MKNIELISKYIDAAFVSDEESLNRIHFMLIHDIRMKKARIGRLVKEPTSTELNERFYNAHKRHLVNFKTIEDER